MWLPTLSTASAGPAEDPDGSGIGNWQENASDVPLGSIANNREITHEDREL